jgi:hypothetical protein
MKDKKYELLYNLITTFQELSAVVNTLAKAIDGNPDRISAVCDRLVDIIMNVFGVSNDDPHLDYYLDEFYGMIDDTDVEDIIQDMLDTIEITK